MTALAQIVVAWLLAFVFVHALQHKIGAWPRFCAVLAAYRLVPDGATKFVAVGVVIFEVAAVVGLVLVAAWGFCIAAALLVVYGMAMGINMSRGRHAIDCGCGDEPTMLSWHLLLRNGVLSLLCLASALSGSAAAVSWVVYAVGGGLALVAILMYLSLEALLANRAKHQRLWMGA